MEHPLTHTIRIDPRFQGPPDSGNGGYVCGLLAPHVGAPEVVARLRVPPPLETDLTVRSADGRARLHDGDVLIAEAWAESLDLEPIEAPTFEAATAAASRFRGHESHWFPSCFVCGPDRKRGDGLCIFPGPLDQRIVAAPWTPDASLTTQGDCVRPEFMWAALDCPGGFSFAEPGSGAILLGEMHARLTGTVRSGERCVLAAWELRHEGRKHYTASALYGEDGACRGVARGTWFEVPAA